LGEDPGTTTQLFSLVNVIIYFEVKDIPSRDGISFLSMRRLPVILIFAITLHLQSCVTPDQRQIAEVTDTLLYDLRVEPSNILQLSEEKFLGMISSQTLSMSISFKNDSENLINIYPGQTTIAGKEGNRSLPLNPRPDTIVLQAGTSSSVKLNFLPVNSRFLFQHTNLRGDLDDEYTVTLSGTTANGMDFEQKILAKADVASYQLALKKFSAQRQIVPYRISGLRKKSGGEYFKNATLSRATEMETKVTDNEILKGGFWIKLMSYHRQDTLHCRMRFVNQSGKAIEILGRDLILLSGSQQIQPLVRSNDAIILQNGDRGEIDLKYPIELAGEYLLNPGGVRATDARKSYFTDLLLLERLELPK
jgi:hypothetical protein